MHNRLPATILTLLFLFASTSAQTQSSPPVHSLLSDAELDALWTARKWYELGAALSNLDSPASFSKSMDWLHTRLDAGGGLMLGILYARDLWMVGKSQNVADPNKDLRLTAGMITLYTYEIIVIDGAKCEDKTAPINRINQFLGSRRETLAYLKQQSQEQKTYVVNLAVAFEKKTADLRKEDDLICRDGMEQYRVALERGTQREVPSPDNHVGKVVDLRPPSDWEPNFVAPAIYQQLQEKSRADLRATLFRLVE